MARRLGLVVLIAASFVFGTATLAFAVPHPVSGTNPAAIAVGLQTLNGIFEDQSNHANDSWKLQFRFLVAGAFLYVVWHVLEMYLRLRG